MSFLEISEYNYNAKPTLSFLLCCCLHLWYNFSSIFARLLLPDLLPPRGMSAPSIAGGTAVPCPTGGTNSRALAEERWRLLWEVQGVSGERLPHPLCSQANQSWNLPRDAWRWQDEASLCAHLAHHLATQGKHSSMYVLSQQLSTFFWWKIALEASWFSEIQLFVNTTVVQKEGSGKVALEATSVVFPNPDRIFFLMEPFLGLLQNKLTLST